jgi:hypothetical protein
MGRLARAEERAAQHFDSQTLHPAAVEGARTGRSAQEVYVERLGERTLEGRQAARWASMNIPNIFEP